MSNTRWSAVLLVGMALALAGRFAMEQVAGLVSVRAPILDLSFLMVERAFSVCALVMAVMLLVRLLPTARMEVMRGE